MKHDEAKLPKNVMIHSPMFLMAFFRLTTVTKTHEPPSSVGPELCAFVASKDDAPSVPALRAQLALRLPSYAVPQRIAVMETSAPVQGSSDPDTIPESTVRHSVC